MSFLQSSTAELEEVFEPESEAPSEVPPEVPPPPELSPDEGVRMRSHPDCTDIPTLGSVVHNLLVWLCFVGNNRLIFLSWV